MTHQTLGTKKQKTKICTICKKELPATREFFTVNSKGKYGLYCQCKQCRNKIKRKQYAERTKEQIKKHQEYFKEYSQKEKEKISRIARSSHLKNKFGITRKTYNAILKDQDGKCAICGAKENCSNFHLAIDHDHDTGKIRGLLCNKCNTGLGSFEDDVNLLEKAIKYLEGNKSA